jgi:DnaK suppressor protein
VNTDRFRELLLAERERVSGAIAYLHAENSGSQGDEIPETGIADTGSVTLDREVDYSLEENSAHVLREIEAALARIEAGTYGRCIDCGKEIPEGRLEIKPEAARCMDDQAKFEQR